LYSVLPFLPQPVARLLSPEAQRLILEIGDEHLRTVVTRALSTCSFALDAIGGLDLERLELLGRDLPNLTKWDEAVPRILEIGGVLERSLVKIAECFPAPRPSQDREVDVDRAFDMLDSDEATFARATELDRIVEDQEPETVGTVVNTLSQMMREDLARFRAQIARPSSTHDRWLLIGELQELQARASQLITAIAAAILKPLWIFAPEVTQKIDHLLPSYASELDRSLQLRDAVAGLARDLERILSQLRPPGAAGAIALQTDVLRRLEQFSQTAAYKRLWARDKRELILQWVKVRDFNANEGSPTEVRQIADGLTRFIEVLASAISHRPEVEAWDREHADLADLIDWLE
jgi:hypothetical protein